MQIHNCMVASWISFYFIGPYSVSILYMHCFGVKKTNMYQVVALLGYISYRLIVGKDKYACFVMFLAQEILIIY